MVQERSLEDQDQPDLHKIIRETSPEGEDSILIGDHDDLVSRGVQSRNPFLDGPIMPVLLKLAAPMVVVLIAQTFVGIAETFFVSFLGTDALAGVVLVFPALMLMTTMSNGGIGGGVAASIARATGAGRQDEAEELAFHALVLGLVFGCIFSAAFLTLGAPLYRALGGEGASLDAAVAYSNFMFAGAIPIWVTNLLAASLRGVGNVRVPALVIMVGTVILIIASPLLIFGFGPVPAFGVAGAGFAVSAYFTGAALVLLRYLAAGRGGLTLRSGRLRWGSFRAILEVGFLSALSTVLVNLTVVLVTGAVSNFGVAALAGYGVASRLDYLLIPLLFGLGTAVVTLVGMNIGAGQYARAHEIAWKAVLLAAGVTEAIGLAAAIFPSFWLGLFTSDASVLEAGSLYLRIVGPAYGAIGLGMVLYFALQGVGNVALPVFAGFIRLLIAAGAGSLAVKTLGFNIEALFTLVAASMVFYGALIGIACWRRIGPGTPLVTPS